MNKIKKARINTGMTRAEVARLLEMPYRTLENWENGANYPAPYIERLIIKELEEYTPLGAKSGNIVTNDYGVDIDYDIAVNMMDDEIREQLHEKLVMQSDEDCTEQKFFDEYCKAHEEKYGEEWELAKENPCY
ncbi:DNA-binding transcriptional regulator [uncultured Ruminococcus sp.]|uniref:helix-turn-helix domain-containing protein n=1 Tax=uncultured Ruminococcus sp. TaxID=165186 RepID=UPI0025DE75B1|nr:helix-turn-helix transcriptional regulator [uncultured Ruminococcus sp.]